MITFRKNYKITMILMLILIFSGLIINFSMASVYLIDNKSSTIYQFNQERRPLENKIYKGYPISAMPISHGMNLSDYKQVQLIFLNHENKEIPERQYFPLLKDKDHWHVQIWELSKKAGICDPLFILQGELTQNNRNKRPIIKIKEGWHINFKSSQCDKLHSIGNWRRFLPEDWTRFLNDSHALRSFYFNDAHPAFKHHWKNSYEGTKQDLYQTLNSYGISNDNIDTVLKYQKWFFKERPKDQPHDVSKKRAIQIKDTHLSNSIINPLVENIKAHNKGIPFLKLGKDLFSFIGSWLGEDLGAFHNTSKQIYTATHQMFLQNRDLARAEIRQLIGPLIQLKPGSFIAGEYLGDYSYSYYSSYNLNSIKQASYIKIDYSYWMPKYDVSQAQYDFLMGEGVAHTLIERGLPNIPSGKNKPMVGLTKLQWDEYLEELNKKLEILWKFAYPGTRVPKAQRPEFVELLYAMTVPLFEKTNAKIIFLGKDTTYLISSLLTVYPGTDQNGDIANYYAVFGKGHNHGPADVDFGLETIRGFKNLTGNVIKQTSTLIEENLIGSGSSYAAHWRESVRSFSNTGMLQFNNDYNRQGWNEIGLRLILK